MFSVLLMSSFVKAEDEQTQRCIWQCLQASGGNAADPGYSQCVANFCVASNGSGTRSAADATASWQARAIVGGGFAGADAIGFPGEVGIYYFCERGRRYLRLVGIEGGGATVQFVIDGRSYPVSFAFGPSGDLEAAVSLQAPVMNAIRSGSQLDFVNASGRKVFSLRLNGSSAAISQAEAMC